MEGQNCNVLSNRWKQGTMPLKIALLMQGLMLLFLGIVSLTFPMATMWLVTVVWGAFLIFHAAFLLSISCSDKKIKFYAILGALGIGIIGIASVVAPFVMEVMWVIMLGCWQIFQSVEMIMWSKKKLKDWMSSLLSFVIGVVFICSPLIGINTIGWLIGVLLFASGILTLVFMFRVPQKA